MMLNSVEDFFKKKRETVEMYNKDKIAELRWEYPDVLYSFRGVYAIGIFIYYRDLFIDHVKTDILLKKKMGKRKQLLYSNNFLWNHYTEFPKVNSLPQIKTFLQCYYDIGNIIPTWPGANVNRGMAHCYDIPNIYYKRHEKFIKFVYSNVYDHVFLDKVLVEQYSTVAELIKMNDEEYVTFLNFIIRVIKDRNVLIEDFLQANKNYE